MTNTPIEILVKKSETATGDLPIVSKEQGKLTPSQQAVNSAMIAAGKQAINAGIRTQAEITGDYVLADTVSFATSFAADILMVAKGGAIGAIAVATKYGLSVAESYAKQRVADRNNEFIRQRTGFIATKGSRYTND